MDLKLEADDELSRRIRRRCLVGKLIWGSSVLSSETVKSLTKFQWRCKGDYSVSQIQPSLFIFSFQYEEDFKTVISNTPHTIKGVLLILSPWVSAKVPSEFQFSFCPFWVQVHNLPFNCFTKENQLQITQLLGNPICLDDVAYGDFVWKKFLRIRVNIDIRNPLPSGFWHHRSGLPDIWVEFKYEKLGNFCYKCGCIGKHHFNNCDVPQGTGCSYGPWMRADEVVTANIGGVLNRGGAGGGGSSVSGGAMIFECVGSKIFGNVDLVDLDETQRAVLVPVNRTVVGEEEETGGGDNHDSGGGVSTCRFPMLQRVVKNMISAVILIVNCKIILGRVAAANDWETINVCLLLLSMFAYLIYLVQAYVHSYRSVRHSTSVVAAVDHVPMNRDLLLFLLVFVLLGFC